VPADQRPTDAEVNVVHLAWDVMVGIATLLFLLSAWYGLSWLFRRDNPKWKLFWWLASAAGVVSIGAMEAGWVVTEVGRQPWIVYNYYKVDQAATTNPGVWVTVPRRRSALHRRRRHAGADPPPHEPALAHRPRPGRERGPLRAPRQSAPATDAEKEPVG
jgi:Cytochrome bd-type quinol oxidase, subunit 1